MRRVSVEMFGNLIAASGRVGDEFDKDVDLIKAPVVQKALDAQKAKDEAIIQKEILGVLDAARIERQNMVSNIRDFRREVEKRLRFLKKLDEAEKVGLTKGDFRPLLTALGVQIPDYKSDT